MNVGSLVRRYIIALLVIMPALVPGPASAAINNRDCIPGSGAVVSAAIEIRQLYIMIDDPQLFVTRFDITYCWDPKKLPHFDPDSINFLNILDDPKIQSIPQAKQPKGLRVASRIYEGRFMTINDTSAFPLDAHLLPILFTFPTSGEHEIKLVVNPGDLEASSHSSRQEKLKISNVKFQEGQLFGTPMARTSTFRRASGPAYAIVVEATRELSGAALIIWLPMLVVWIIAYTGLWWKSIGAISRASVSALFTAAGLSMSTMTLRPHGDQLDGAILSFILIYLNIVVIMLLSLVAHRYLDNGHLKTYQKLRTNGRRYIAPAMLFISIATVAWWCSQSGLEIEKKEFYLHFQPLDAETNASEQAPANTGRTWVTEGNTD